MDHFILTRFNVVMGWQAGETARKPGWLEHRVAWFEKWTLPSVASQSCQEFRWLVFFDSQTPTGIIERARNWPKAEPILIPEAEDDRFRWYTFLRAASLAVTKRSRSEWVAQTRLDNDDRIAWDFVEILHTHLEERYEWLTFPLGSVHDGEHTYRRVCANNPFVTFVESMPSILTPYCSHHDRLAEHAPVREMKGAVMWQTMLHDRNLANTRGLTRCTKPMPEHETANRFQRTPIHRVEFLNKVIDLRGGQSYLEIGVHKGDTFNAVNARTKVGVDPNGPASFPGTSDEFFACNTDCFELVFIDGSHRCEDALRDARNALRFLNPGGVIVMHDCLPAKREHQLREPTVSTWNGDVWKALVHLRADPEVDAAVLNSDFGLGVVLPRENSDPIAIPEPLTWETYQTQRWDLLRLMSLDSMLQFLG